MMFYLILTLLLVACPGASASPSKASSGSPPLLIATTTSLQDTGLLDRITDLFTKKTGIKVKAVSMGSGQALKAGERGDVDILLVHSPVAEEQFMKKGFGKSRKEFLYNYFLLAGPKSDPARIRDARTPEEAFRRIYEKKCSFVSRADNSGTHVKERELWEKLRLRPVGNWYIESGAGAAQSLRIADEKKAYILIDESTFAVLKDKLELAGFLEKHALLKNTYSIILLNPEKFPGVCYTSAKKFEAFLYGKECQDIIRNFRSPRGAGLFSPVPGK